MDSLVRRIPLPARLLSAVAPSRVGCGKGFERETAVGRSQINEGGQTASLMRTLESERTSAYWAEYRWAFMSCAMILGSSFRNAFGRTYICT